jgi:hypothetical protein
MAEVAAENEEIRGVRVDICAELERGADEYTVVEKRGDIGMS